MDNTEAIGILRGTTSPASVIHPQIAADMGANALAAWEVVRREGQPPRLTMDGTWRFIYQQWDGVVIDGEGPTPLEAVMDAMIKEATDGR